MKLTLDPSCFFTWISSTIIFDVLRLTVSIFPVFPLNFPTQIFTLSPFFAGIFLLFVFFLNSFDKLILTNFFLRCNGALATYFLFFLGCLLDFHCVENFFFFFLYYRGYFGNLCPSFLNLPCNWSFNLSSFWISFFIL